MRGNARCIRDDDYRKMSYGGSSRVLYVGLGYWHTLYRVYTASYFHACWPLQSTEGEMKRRRIQGRKDLRIS